MYNITDLLIRSAQRVPSRIAVRFGEHAASYADLADQVQAVAAGLRAQGVSPGDRVAIYTEKRIETVAALFAVSGIRAVFVPVNPLLKAEQVKHILNDSGAAMLITTPARLASLPFLSKHAQGLRILVVGAGADLPPGAVSWPDIAGHAPGRGTLLRGTDHDIAAILYTSGSTGRAKGVVLSQRNLIAGAESVNAYLPNTQEDVILSVLPLSFDAGFSQLTTAFHVGAQVVLLNYLRPQDIADACDRYRVTAVTAVPPLWNQIAAARFTSAAAERLRYFANTGGHLSRPLLQQLRALFPNAKPFLMYGLTEAFRSTCLDPAEIDRRPDSIGKAVPNAEVLVLRPDGTECRPGEPGELVHRGAFVTRGYWNDPERTAERFRPLPSWPAAPSPELAVWSGDIVRKDEEGFLYYIGRNDEMIKTQGYRVSPTEIEDVVYQSGLVAEAAAVGVPHAERGAAIVLVAAAGEGIDVDAEAIRRHCARCLPSYMIPLSIISQPSLPRNVNGKLHRQKIKAQVLALFSGAERHSRGDQSMTPYRFAARLERSPFVGVPAPASGRIFPLASDSDFSVMSRLPKREGLPVYLSVPEHYRLLADIIEGIGAALRGVEFILMQFKAPYMAPLPDALLRAHVLLTADAAPERDRLLAQGRPFVTVEDSLLRDPCEDGLNELCITCYTPGVTEEAFRAAIAALPWLGAFGVIDRPVVEPFPLSMHYG